MTHKKFNVVEMVLYGTPLHSLPSQRHTSYVHVPFFDVTASLYDAQESDVSLVATSLWADLARLTLLHAF